MIRSKLCVLAESVVQDVQTNTISIFVIIEDLNTQGFPLFIPKMTFFVSWERDLTDLSQYNAEFSVTLNEQRLHTAPVNIDFRNALRHRSIVTVGGLVIPQPGQLTFSLKIHEGPETTCTLSVKAPESVITTG